MKTVTLKMLDKLGACKEAVAWVRQIKKTNPAHILALAIKAGDKEHLRWANWGMARLLNRKNRIRYAIFAAEQVIDIYENKYPDDKRPRKAIEAAKAVLAKDSDKNRAAADAAAAYAAYAAYAAADAAAYDAAASWRMMQITILEYGLKLLLKQSGGEII